MYNEDRYKATRLNDIKRLQPLTIGYQKNISRI